MGNIQRRPDGRWRARFRDDTGRERSKHFTRKVDAQRWLDLVSVSRGAGTYVDPSHGRTRVNEIAQQWFAAKAGLVKPKTREGYRGILNGVVLPRWGKTRVADITTSGIEAWVSELSLAGRSASRVRQAHVVLKGVLDTAVKARTLAMNPAIGITLPRLPESGRRHLTGEELERLAAAAEGYSTLVRVLGYCGIRWGEAVGLTVASLDLDRGRLRVTGSVSDVNGVLSRGTTKTGRGREVPLPPFLRDDLRMLVADRRPTDLVFPSPQGSGFLRNGNFRRDVFDRAARQAGLDGLTPHELRHTAASLAIRSGANIKVVQAMLGHASATMTWDLYGHLYGDDLDALGERMHQARQTSMENFADFLRTRGQEREVDEPADLDRFGL